MIILEESDGTCQNLMSKFKGDLPPKILPEITILAIISQGGYKKILTRFVNWKFDDVFCKEKISYSKSTAKGAKFCIL
jgi:hypothetical protein